MIVEGNFRPFASSDRESCLAIFDANCPEFFAVHERIDYEQYLKTHSDEYEVCEIEGAVVAGFGIASDSRNESRLNWIMVDPKAKASGLGTSIMSRVISRSMKSQSGLIRIAASHKSAPFFAKFGAVATKHTEDGWGDGMHRIDMELRL